MKLQLVSLGILPVLITIPKSIASSLASKISCMSVNGMPTTVVTTNTGKQVPIIYWRSSTFSESGWTPKRRCQEVSMRFQQFHTTNNLKYITTGRMNNMPVICVANSNGGGCAGLLYTLKPGQNATSTLRKLLDIQKKAGSAPLEETTSRLYVSVDSLIRNKSGESPTTYQMAPTPSSSPSMPLF